MASKLIVNEIEHTDGSGTAVTMAKATITDLTSGTLGSGVTGGSGLTALGTVTAGNLSHADIVYPAGHVVHVKADDFTGSADASTNTSYLTTGNSITILSADVAKGSKIIILLSHIIRFKGGSSGKGRIDYRLVRTAPGAEVTIFACLWVGSDDTNTNLTQTAYIGNTGVDEDLSTGDHTYDLQYRAAGGEASEITYMYKNWYSGSTNSIVGMVIK